MKSAGGSPEGGFCGRPAASGVRWKVKVGVQRPYPRGMASFEFAFRDKTVAKRKSAGMHVSPSWPGERG